MGFSQNSYREINGSAFLFFPFHFFSSQKWHRRRGFNQPIQKNKWRRDPISSWQSFWKRGQLISQRSPQLSAEQPVLPAPCVVWSSSALLPSTEVSAWRETPSECCSLIAAKSYSLTSRPAVFICICVCKKNASFCKHFYFSALPSIFFPIPRKHPVLGDSAKKKWKYPGVFLQL